MFKLSSIIILAISCLLGAAVGQIVETGQCNQNIALVNNFNINSFVGTWYELQRSDSPEQTTECAAFSFTSANNVINVQHNGVNDNFSQGGSGTATLVTNTAQLSVNIPNWFTGSMNFWVLSTDYTSYAVTYSCENISATQRRIYLWVLGRARTYASTVEQTFIANTINTLLGIQLSTLKTVDHSDTACLTLPEIPSGQPIVLTGQCDTNIRVEQNFNVAAFTGTWHQIYTYYTENSVGNCARAQYTAAGSVVNVLNSQVINQALLTITGTATVASTDNSARLKVILDVAGQNQEQDLWIISTDYNNYAISYSCENISGTQKRIYSWILGRNRQLSAAVQASVDQVVGSVTELNYRYFTTTDQSDTACFYLPEVTGQPVQFPGQCDTNISPMANFNAAQYLGLWYDVESYPAPFQTGSCSLADYSLNADSTVRVENSQVINQGLETWIGSAVPATDGSASLEVTFIINGQPVRSTLWVLATDYTSYSYVYSCDNNGADSRLVYSWKLSRTPSLTAQATTAINAIMNTIPVLDQRYYVARGHTAADCLGGNVILSGQCIADNQVQAVTNFNANNFAGTWYEISRFPSSLEQGDCVASQLTLTAANTFTFVNTAVENERLISTSNQATTPTSGRGVISINGVPFNDIYVLATDYTDYALAYACRNVNAQYKQVYSWKLSKSASGLSQNANTAINQIVSANADLSETNYKLTSRDNDACFYYPVFAQLPSSIELPGPCPTNIRGIANFNAGNYLGTWYEIARYPVEFQFGQCSRAEYSTGNRVVVSNTEVVNQQLQVQNGFADLASTDGSGLLNVEFVVNGVTTNSPYYILATDYTSYSLVYSCESLANGNRRVSSWKLSRTPTLSAAAVNAMTPLIASTQGLSEDYYQATSQTAEACFYIPEVNVNEAPLFRGQCETMTGITGFNVQRYLGVWNEIESYPVDGGITGQCRRSDYSLDGTTYRVVDTQIQNNVRTDVSGTVTVSNTGRLQRVMADGTTQDIWVLATDYDNYALLYSCENVGTEYRRVWSAKHSKARTLSTAAQTAIDAVINNNAVLDSRFYQQISQTDNACFYYPTITQGLIVIPGQCDAAIPVVSNFNAEQFSGDWYHLERYDDLGGSSCIGSRYTVENDGITVLNFEVRDGELQTVEGSATITGSNGGGVIELTFPVGDTTATTTSHVSILATDYTNFALAYSCTNVGSDQRQVRAWKLSREQTMSTVGTTTINGLIESRQELHQPYFKQITQQEDCPKPSSAFLAQSSIMILLVCAFLQRLL